MRTSWFGIVLLLVPALVAFPTKAADLALTTDQACYGQSGATVTVSVDLTNAGVAVVGGQFFLYYDQNVLQLQDMMPGDEPFVIEIYEIVPGDGGPGTIDYAVSTVPGGTGTSSDSTMAIIRFTALTEFCGLSGFVSFRQHDPPTRLSDDTGGDVSVSLTNLSCPGGACDDGNACTTNDTCSGGVCVGGPPLVCDDGNVCTTDSCDPDTGCTYTDNNVMCDDGNSCTSYDVCSNGACSGIPVDCSDNNVCTDDLCNPATGCYHLNNTNSCNDHHICTINDTCAGGFCSGTQLLNCTECTINSDCNDGEVCTTDICLNGVCVYTSNSGPCNDNNACTINDACSNGVCHGSPLNCNDVNVCTDDSCNPTSGCVHVNNTNSCSDGNACTSNDTCGGGVCHIGPPLDCDDGNVCTNDSCNPASGCVHANNTNLCNDGSVCTKNDVCSGGMCIGTIINCDDGNLCTDDFCDSLTGCHHVDNTRSCNDGNICTTNDTCSGGTCGGMALNCDDGNPCTDDFCNPGTGGGCYHVNNTAPCDDGNICTTNDTCSGGNCVGGPPLGCNLGTVCTTGICHPDAGCVYTNNNVVCDDGDACTSYDVCSDGDCSGVPVDCDDSNVCTDDFCDPGTGCHHVNNTSICNDHHDCTANDTCAGGLCNGTPILNCIECTVDGDCDDGHLCTTDICLNGVCVYTYNSGPCDDGNACTTNDTCSNGACHGTPRNCDDGNVCTDDSCNPAIGCIHVNNINSCSDGNACTTNDTCFGSLCHGGPPLNCDDGNPCTNDTCFPASGCSHVNNTSPCSDGNECTTDDACLGGICVGGPPLDCDDSNACTDDSCDLLLGCRYIFNSNPCDDGNPCTDNDVCTIGTCRGTQTCGLSTPFPDPSGIDKVRYLSFQIQASLSGPGATSLQVKLVHLMHPDPQDIPQFPAPDFTAAEGQVRYVGTPGECLETELPHTTYKCALLQCTPVYMDWVTALGGQTIHVTGQEVVPSSIYEVRQLAIACQGNEMSCMSLSDPQTIKTQRWGDVFAGFQLPFPAALTQPNITDVAACVDKFKGVPSAIIVARADVNPAIPNGRVDIADIANIVDGFKNHAYPFPGPVACP